MHHPKKEIYYFIGFVGVAVARALVMAPAFGLVGIWRTLACMAGGLACGLLSEYTYRSNMQQK